MKMLRLYLNLDEPSIFEHWALRWLRGDVSAAQSKLQHSWIQRLPTHLSVGRNVSGRLLLRCAGNCGAISFLWSPAF